MTEVGYEDPTTTLAYIISDPPDRSDRFTQPVEPVGTTLPTPPVRPVYAKQKGCTLSPQVYNSTAP